MMNFKDNFSKQSNIYLKYRPTYPIELFEYLSSLTKEHEVAWDCGTGNGQAALSLTNFYKRVFATDPSKKQIGNAPANPKIIYRVEKAEESKLEQNSVDLITSANAVHWFNFDEFYAKAKFVLKPSGIIAVWTYTLPHISEVINEIIKDFHDNVVGEFWQYENSLVVSEYAAIPFPFSQLPSPNFKIRKKLFLEEMMGFVSSWSAVQRFIEKNGFSPLQKLGEQLKKVWNEKEQKESVWKIILKIGKNN